MDPEQQVYRVWNELAPPLHPAYWWLIRWGLVWPGKDAWLGKAEAGTRRRAERLGMTLIGDPVGVAFRRNGRVVVSASALAEGPPGLVEGYEDGPVDVVDRGGEEDQVE